ncbi:MAG: serine protease, partial [Planctomycetes bacterium RBG_13_63_9]
MRRSPLLVAAMVLLVSSVFGAEIASIDVDQAVLEAEAQRIAVMDRAKDSVLAIFARDGGGGGSGVVISPDGYALTNFHVVRPCGHAMKCGMADGQLYDAVLVGIDPTGDVALIRLFGRDDFPHARLADSDRVEVGDWCFAMGNPFLLAVDFRPTVTYGIVSGTHRYQYPAGTLLEYTDCIQTDASINPGNSGGPLFDAAGGLIGINGRGSFEKRGRVNVGVAYAVSINQIKNFLGQLRGGRIVDHATLGALVSSNEDGRVVVDDVLERSDAYRRGLRYGDEIVSFGGRAISTPNGFKNALGIYPKGWRVPLSFRRDGRRYDVLVRLQGVHGEEELLEKARGRAGNLPMPLPKPDQQRKPGEEPGPGGVPQPKRPGIPVPEPDDVPPIQLLPKAAIAKVVREHFRARRGYANYYFNQLNRDRVWKAWTARADCRELRG